MKIRTVASVLVALIFCAALVHVVLPLHAMDVENEAPTGKNHPSSWPHMPAAKVHAKAAAQEHEEREGSVPGSELEIPCGESAQQMVYWKKEDKVPSPYVDLAAPQQFVSFEYDLGGWNNIRMGFESVVAFALGSGRTVVLPPAKPLYLLDKDASQKHHGFLDFFEIEKLERRFPGSFIGVYRCVCVCVCVCVFGFVCTCVLSMYVYVCVCVCV
jgi:hypothetical protein